MATDKPKRKKPVSTVQMTLKVLRGMDLAAEVCEKWIPGANIRRDLFNIADIVAVGYKIGFIQTTTYNNKGSHIKKIEENPMLLTLLAAGAVVTMFVWKKVKNKWGFEIIMWDINEEGGVERSV